MLEVDVVAVESEPQTLLGQPHWRTRECCQEASTAALSFASPVSKSLPSALSTNSRPARSMSRLRLPLIVQDTRVPSPSGVKAKTVLLLCLNG